MNRFAKHCCRSLLIPRKCSLVSHVIHDRHGSSPLPGARMTHFGPIIAVLRISPIHVCPITEKHYKGGDKESNLNGGAKLGLAYTKQNLIFADPTKAYKRPLSGRTLSVCRAAQISCGGVVASRTNGIAIPLDLRSQRPPTPDLPRPTPNTALPGRIIVQDMRHHNHEYQH